MNELIVTLPRRVIPRWRDFATTAALGELGSLRNGPKVELPTADIDTAKLVWATNKSALSAGDLLTAAIVGRNWPEAEEAAFFLLRDDVVAPGFTKDIARKVLEWSKQEVMFPLREPNSSELAAFDTRTIGIIRRTLAHFPNSPIHWIELALGYTIIGRKDKARRGVMTALSLAPDDRFVMRCATRFFLHHKEPEMAKRILARGQRVENDPWLLAAHMSVADIMGEPPKLYRQARGIFSSNSFSSFHLSELGSALATVELKSGNDRRARKLFEKSLKNPTENAVAQAVWAKKEDVVRGHDNLLTLPFSFESNAFSLIHAEEWDRALSAAQGWQRDEPFSARPAVLGSFLACSAQEDFETAQKIARIGLMANPSDAILTNNLIFSLASSGNVEKAKRLLAQYQPESIKPENEVTLTATQGLIEYRQGNYLEGREKYCKAIEMASEHKLTSHYIRAFIYFAREELRLKTPGSMELAEEAMRAASIHSDPVVRVVLKRLESAVAAMAQPEEVKKSEEPQFMKLDIAGWDKPIRPRPKLPGI